MADQNFTVRRGDTLVFTITCTRAAAAVNLTGAKLWFTAKYRVDDTDDLAVLRQDSLVGGSHGGITIGVPATDGIATLVVLPAATLALTKPTSLVYDVQLKETDATITTVAAGILTVNVDVTQRTT